VVDLLFLETKGFGFKWLGHLSRRA